MVGAEPSAPPPPAALKGFGDDGAAAWTPAVQQTFRETKRQLRTLMAAMDVTRPWRHTGLIDVLRTEMLVRFAGGMTHSARGRVHAQPRPVSFSALAVFFGADGVFSRVGRVFFSALMASVGCSRVRRRACSTAGRGKRRSAS